MINQNKKMNLREKDRRGKMVIAVLLLIAIIGVGYAALGANLKINGVANIPSASWDVHFKTGSINVTEGSVAIDTTNNEQAATITNTTQVDYAVKLALPGDFYEFTVIAENTGTIDAMIDSVVSKRGDVVITIGTLPSYIDYSVTYSDGIEIAPKQILGKNTEETYKVRIAYKTDIEASELPSEAVTLNLNFQINYVQADDTGIEVNHPISGQVNLGDYISLTPDKSTYTISSSLTGYDSDQTINPSELNLWRVISKNDDDSVDVVSEYVSSTAVSFQGTTGYANFVGGLQTIAEQYAKEGYTKSTRMMGYDGQTLTISDTSAFDGSTNTAPSTTTTPNPTTGTGEEYSGGIFGDTLYLKDYTLVSNVYKSDTTTYGSDGLKAYKVGTTNSTSYWVSSRKFFNFDATNFEFAGRTYHESGTFSSTSLRNVFNGSWGDEDYPKSYSVRPILTLKSGVSIASGSGTSASPYVLN